MQKLPSSSSEAMDSYVKALEEERKKIMVFERELPLSLHIISQAIESCRRQREEQQQRVDGSEEITSEGPVLEEFIPLKPANSCSSAEEISDHDKNCNGDKKKPDWMRSVQLWNQETEPPTQDVLRKPIAVNAKRVGAGGAFHPFEREKNVKGAAVAAPSSSTSENNNAREEKEKKEKEGQSSQRKARRCWSAELHRRFLNALQQLGGSHAATPKQIRELMKVDELTNDEVKSHLQKYRLHTRRPTTGAVQNSSSSSSHPTPQIVFVGGLWMPPPEYTAAAAAAAATAAAQPAIDTGSAPFNGVYAPVASLPSELGSELVQQIKQQLKRSPTGPLKSEGRSSGDDNSDGERTNSDSSATASSSQTTTGSPSSSSRR